MFKGIKNNLVEEWGEEKWLCNECVHQYCTVISDKLSGRGTNLVDSATNNYLRLHPKIWFRENSKAPHKSNGSDFKSGYEKVEAINARHPQPPPLLRGEPCLFLSFSPGSHSFRSCDDASNTEPTSLSTSTKQIYFSLHILLISSFNSLIDWFLSFNWPDCNTFNIKGILYNTIRNDLKLISSREVNKPLGPVEWDPGALSSGKQTHEEIQRDGVRGS